MEERCDGTLQQQTLGKDFIPIKLSRDGRKDRDGLSRGGWHERRAMCRFLVVFFFVLFSFRLLLHSTSRGRDFKNRSPRGTLHGRWEWRWGFACPCPRTRWDCSSPSRDKKASDDHFLPSLQTSGPVQQQILSQGLYSTVCDAHRDSELTRKRSRIMDRG